MKPVQNGTNSRGRYGERGVERAIVYHRAYLPLIHRQERPKLQAERR